MVKSIWWVFVGGVLVYLYQDPEKLNLIVELINNFKDQFTQSNLDLPGN